VKRIGDKAMTQKERTRKYFDEHNLVLFSTRIEGDLANKLKIKLERENITKKQFLVDAIKRFLG